MKCVSYKNIFLVEYDYYDDEPLPSGPTREPPLPSGPTRRPGQARPAHPKSRKTVSPALNQFLNLPFLTTQKPKKLKKMKRIQRPQILQKLGPFHQHFIAPPKLNAGNYSRHFSSTVIKTIIFRSSSSGFRVNSSTESFSTF